MARISSQKAVEMVGNRFDLILIAAARAREISKKNTTTTTGNRPCVQALRDVESGLVGREYLRKIR